MSESGSESPSTGGNDRCCVPVEELLAVRDLDKAAPWKSGNQYRLVCPDCRATQFTSKNLWQSRKTQYVIPRGEDELVVLYECPHCQGDIYGEADTCPECGEGIDWSEDEPDKQEPEPDDEELEDEDEDDDKIPYDVAQERLEDKTDDQLYDIAVDLDIDGRTDMNKGEKVEAILEARVEEGKVASA